MSEHPLGLQGDEYWTHPFKNQLGVFDATVREMKPALVIDAPPEVDLGKRTTIPVATIYSASLADAVKVPLEKGAILAAVRLEDREAFVGFAVDRGKPMPGDPDEEPDDSTFVGRTLVTDMKAQLGIGNGAGTYVLTMLLREKVSNRVRISVRPVASDYTDPEVQKFLERQPLPLPAPVSPVPGSPFPAYARIEGSPAIPDQPGVALAAERVAGPGAKAVITGSFRVSALRREITGGKVAIPGAPDNAPKPTAIVPIRLVVVSTDRENFGPYQMKIRAPSFDAIQDGAQDPMVTGYFAVDIFSMGGVEPKEVTYFVYAFLGEWMAGPVPVGVVTKEMLPK